MEDKLKRNKYFFVLAVLVLLVPLTLLSCVPPTTTAAAPTVSPITQVQTEVATLKTDLASLKETKASTSKTTELESRLSTVEGKINALQSQGAANAYTKSETYTKAEIDAAIAALKSNQTWITVATGTGDTSTTTPTTGQVTYRVYKSAEDVSPVYTESSYTWWLEISNGFTEYKKVFVSCILVPNSGSTINGDIQIWNNSTYPPTGTYLYSPDMIGGLVAPNTMGAFSMNYVPTTGIKTTMISGNSQGHLIIKGNDKKVIPITLVLDYVTGATQWTATFSTTAVNYP